MATAVVRLWFDRAPDGGSEAGILSGDLVPDNFFWLHRIQDPYIRWHRATGGSAVEVHVYGPPEILELPDAMLLARAIVEVSWTRPLEVGDVLVDDVPVGIISPGEIFGAMAALASSAVPVAAAATAAASPNMMVNRLSMLMPRRLTDSRAAMPARPTRATWPFPPISPIPGRRTTSANWTGL